ncbi:MAG: hypothetical protein E7337_17265 [Clostridiales bacterium]|nr:hypothetical protein [Clostridiales bacterium]
MRLDGRDCFGEEYELFSYQPQRCALMCGMRHSGLYYKYHGETRKDRLNHLARQEPELEFVIACVYEMGLFEDCAELWIWREVCADLPKELRRQHRNSMPGFVRNIRQRSDAARIFKELYFSDVFPVAAAMDAGETEIACALYVQTVEKLKKMADES